MATRVYISVISHNQQDLIQRYYHNFPKQLGDFDIQLSILDNTGSQALRDYCRKEGYYYYHDGKQRGFGANHNLMFRQLQVSDNDIFIIANPDLMIEKVQLAGMLERFVRSGADLFTVKIYLDKEQGILDYPDRYFPGILNFPISILTGRRLHYGSREELDNPEWVSGSFIVFQPSAFRKLNGFDEGYYMYCEDIDLCYRARRMGMKLLMDPEFYIEHDTRMHSRKIFSRNFYWHVASTIRYIVKNRIFKPIVIAKT